MERPKILRLEDYFPKPPPGPHNSPASGRKVRTEEEINNEPLPVIMAKAA